MDPEQSPTPELPETPEDAPRLEDVEPPTTTAELTERERQLLYEFRLLALHHGEETVFTPMFSTGDPSIAAFIFGIVDQAQDAARQEHDGELFGFVVKLGDQREIRKHQHQFMATMLSRVFLPMPYETRDSPVFGEVDERVIIQ
jgi:hypothetical protein